MLMLSRSASPLSDKKLCFYTIQLVMLQCSSGTETPLPSGDCPKGPCAIALRGGSLLGDGLQQLQEQEAPQEAVGARQQRHLWLSWQLRC